MLKLTENVLNFWFGTTDLHAQIKPKKIWFKSSSEFDQDIRKKFLKDYKNAVAERLNIMKKNQKGCLALIIILDQFSRNLFRHSPKAFAADAKARDIAYYAISKQYDRGISNAAKLFFYLPLEHSENLADQKLSLKLLNNINDKKTSRAAIQHYEIIHRFGRFPHRNAILSRENTPEEIRYLKNPPNW